MTNKDLGTKRDLQYVVAETALTRLLNSQNREKVYKPDSPNLVNVF